MVTAGEFAFLERLRALLPEPPSDEVWIGDDTAVLGGGLLLATDAVVDGVHFDQRWSTPEDAGWEALAVNLSDVAAMGGVPVAAVAALVVPGGAPGLADAVARGLADAAAAFTCPLVGGDTTTGPVLVISVAIVGRADRPVLRSGARPGDVIAVTGELGGGAAALRSARTGARDHPGLGRLRRPVPQLGAGRAAAAAGATAMIDLSDGFAADLGHVLDASGVGARIERGQLPVARGATFDDAVAGGDDYELCITAPDGDRLAAAFESAGLAPPTVVGRCTASLERLVVDGDVRDPLTARGWEHTVE
jgi:thiamine-monophosphate kinase